MATTGRRPRRSFVASASAATVGLLASGHAKAADVPRSHRRVVTGTTSSGKSTVMTDGPVPSGGIWSKPKAGYSSELWIVPKTPGSLTDERDPVESGTLPDWPPLGGVIARIITWEPGFAFRMHRSATIDFIFVVSGHIELLLDEKSVVVGPGDTVVQRGTHHGWRVVGDEPCTFAAVLVSAS